MLYQKCVEYFRKNFVKIPNLLDILFTFNNNKQLKKNRNTLQLQSFKYNKLNDFLKAFQMFSQK